MQIYQHGRSILSQDCIDVKCLINISCTILTVYRQYITSGIFELLIYTVELHKKGNQLNKHKGSDPVVVNTCHRIKITSTVSFAIYHEHVNFLISFFWCTGIPSRNLQGNL